MIKLIAFLGNYGKEYEGTRHNAGFFCADNLELTKNSLWKNKFDGEYAKIENSYLNEPLHLLKPHTYMNASGNAIIKLMQFFKIKPEELLVFHDELELDKACISLKYSGGLGGHNGLRSIKANLASPDFWRVRIGIGRPTNKNANIADYVLSHFSQNELDNLYFQLNKLDVLVNNIISCKSFEQIEALLPTWSKVKLEI